MAQLLDQDGNPIKKQDLLTEQATPTLTGVRQILTDHPTSGLNPSRLGRILRRAEQGDTVSYLEMAEELEEKDLHYLSVMGTRKRAVSQLDITVEPASDSAEDVANADLVSAWLKRDQLQDELFDIMDGVGKGYSQVEMIWDTSSGDWTVKDLVWRDPRWFRFDDNDGTTLYLVGDGNESLPLTSYKYISHRPKAKSGIPIRGGLARPVSWMYLFKNFAVKDWVIFMEAYGQPIRVGKYGPGASADDRKILMKAVSSIASDAGCIIPDSMMIEFVEAQGKSLTAEVFQNFTKFANAEISKVVLGQTMTTEDGSSLAQAEVHNDVRRDIEKADAKQLAATLTRDLVRPLVAFNRGPQKAYPRICIGRAEDVDIAKVSEAAVKVVSIGGRVSNSGLVSMLGLPEPKSEDDVLKAVSSQAVGFNDAIGKQGASMQRHGDGCPHCLGNDPAQPDMIDDFADEMANDWEEILDPIVAMLERAIENATSFDEFNQDLLTLVSKLKLNPMQERVTRAMFQARLAGRLGVTTDKQS